MAPSHLYGYAKKKKKKKIKKTYKIIKILKKKEKKDVVSSAVQVKTSSRHLPGSDLNAK